MKKIKFCLTSVLALVLAVSNSIPLYAKECKNSQIEATESLLVVSDTEQYHAIMKDVSTDSHASIYDVEENGVVYRMVIDNYHDQVIVDGIPYRYQQFEEALKVQSSALTNSQYQNKSEDYALVNILKKFPVYRCTACGLSPVAAPSSGYTEKYRYVGDKNATVELILTAAGYAAAAKKLGIPVNYVKDLFKALISLGYTKYGSVNVHYSLYQCSHTRCPRAYKDKKVFKETGDVYYNTYYAFNPY